MLKDERIRAEVSKVAAGLPLLTLMALIGSCSISGIETATPSAPRPTIVSGPTPTNLAYDPADDDFECTEPLPRVINWLEELTHDSFTWVWQTGDVVQVYVGAGNDPAVDWWIVAVREHNPHGRRADLVFLTDAPGLESEQNETWIRVDQFNVMQGIVNDGWELVHWPTERIEKGRRAEAFALGCIA